MPEPDQPFRESLDPVPGSPGPRIEIAIDPSIDLDLPISRLSQAAAAAALARGFSKGELGIRVTDDESIRVLNARHLNHDYATDVISFSYLCQDNEIQGELVLSADTARRRAAELGWSTVNELLLYVVHGVLHISGMDDRQPHDRQLMRQLEQQVLISLGVDQIVRFGADAAFENEVFENESSDSSEASA